MKLESRYSTAAVTRSSRESGASSTGLRAMPRSRRASAAFAWPVDRGRHRWGRRCARASPQASGGAEAGRTLAVPSRTLEPKVTTKELGDRYAPLHRHQPQRRRASPLREPEARGLPGRHRRARLETPPACTRSKAWQRTRPGACPTRRGPATSAGKVIPGNDPDNPIKARWMGWNGAGIHGTADEASIGTAASRVHPHADPRRDRPVRPRAAAHASVDRVAGGAAPGGRSPGATLGVVERYGP